jgi:hypothetical protein
VRHERQPTGAAAVAEYVEEVGADGVTLLRAALAADAPQAIQKLAEVDVLRRVWIQQFWYDELAGSGGGKPSSLARV